MKKNEFQKLRPGIVLIRKMDIGLIFLTVKDAFRKDDIDYVLFEGDKKPRTWVGQFKRLSIAEQDLFHLEHTS